MSESVKERAVASGAQAEAATRAGSGATPPSGLGTAAAGTGTAAAGSSEPSGEVLRSGTTPLPEVELGIGNAIHVNAYKLAGLVPGSLALILADHLPWQQVFLITSLFMAPGLVMTLMVKEPFSASGAPRSVPTATCC